MGQAVSRALLVVSAEGLLPLSRLAATESWVRSSSERHPALDESRLAAEADPLLLGVMEYRDVPAVASVIAESFSSVVVNTPAGSWESTALDGVAKVVETYDVRGLALLRRSRASQVVEYSLGLRLRCGERISRPRDLAVPDDPCSVVVAVARTDSVDAVAAVELRLRQADGTAPGPFVFLDKLRPRRDLAPTRPYVSNLCVAKRCRRQGFAKALLDAAEFVAGHLWGYDSIFLHVHENNQAALDLYRRAGYLAVASDKTAYAAPSLIYHYKPLSADTPDLAAIERHILRDDLFPVRPAASS